MGEKGVAEDTASIHDTHAPLASMQPSILHTSPLTICRHTHSHTRMQSLRFLSSALLEWDKWTRRTHTHIAHIHSTCTSHTHKHPPAPTHAHHMTYPRLCAAAVVGQVDTALSEALGRVVPRHRARHLQRHSLLHRQHIRWISFWTNLQGARRSSETLRSGDYDTLRLGDSETLRLRDSDTLRLSVCLSDPSHVDIANSCKNSDDPYVFTLLI